MISYQCSFHVILLYNHKIEIHLKSYIFLFLVNIINYAEGEGFIKCGAVLTVIVRQTDCYEHIRDIGTSNMSYKAKVLYDFNAEDTEELSVR